MRNAWTFKGPAGFPCLFMLAALSAPVHASGEGRTAQADGGAPGDQRPADVSLEELRASVSQARQALKSLLLEYRATNTIAGETVYGNGKYVLRRIAVKGRRRYMETAHVEGDRRPEADARYSIGYYDGQSWDAYYPNDLIYEKFRRLKGYEVTTMKILGEAMLESLAWWPADDPSPPPALVSGRPFFLHQVLADKGCVLLPEQEHVNGRWCHVVEVSGEDVLWIDAAAGCLVRRRCFGDTPRRPLMSYDLQDHREVAPGVWLPFRVQRVEHSARTGGPFRQSDYQVSRCLVNNVPDKLFQFTPRPGTFIYDRDTDTGYQVPGGLDLLEIVCRRVGNATQGDRPRGEVSLAYWLLGGVGLYLLGWAVVGLGRLVVRSRRGRRVLSPVG